MALMMPAAIVLIGEQECEMRFEVAKLGFALAAYHVDHDSYPEALADLAPKYLMKIPKDTFADDEFRYGRHEDGYLLYSIGINGRDDGGSSDDSQNHDDLAIRVPAEKKP